MTVEGEKDDISGVGQTKATHDLCVNIPKHRQLYHLQDKVGHYGVFNGSRFTPHRAGDEPVHGRCGGDV
jgi:poly(3-hydroxybutyrate) depolymerase